MLVGRRRDGVSMPRAPVDSTWAAWQTEKKMQRIYYAGRALGQRGAALHHDERAVDVAAGRDDGAIRVVGRLDERWQRVADGRVRVQRGLCLVVAHPVAELDRVLVERAVHGARHLHAALQRAGRGVSGQRASMVVGRRARAQQRAASADESQAIYPSCCSLR